MVVFRDAGQQKTASFGLAVFRESLALSSGLR